MNESQISYDTVKEYIKNKDRAVENNIKTYLNKTQSMFKYIGLPDTIPYSELESILQKNGHCFITMVKNKLYALSGTLGGELDEYQRPTKYTVSNNGLNLYRTYDIETGGVLIKNDTEKLGLLPIIYKYSGLLVDNTITLNTISVLSRISLLLSAPDDKTKASAELFISKILDGDFSVIGSNGFFEGIDVHNPKGNTDGMIPLIEYNQYIKASLLNELGLNANFNMKRERLSDEEVELNSDGLLPLVENMLQERRRGFKKVNEMFETEINVELFSVWRNNREMSEKQLSMTDKPDVEEMENQSVDDEEPDDLPDEPEELTDEQDEETDPEESTKEPEESDEDEDEDEDEFIKSFKPDKKGVE